MPTVTEIAPDLYRFSLFVPEINLQFNHFLLNDDEPLLFTTGYRRTFPLLREAVQKVIDPARIRWIGFSHFESDECGALNEWLGVAPQAEAVSSVTSTLVNLTDFADRPPRALADGEVLATGKYRLRFCATPHLPHGWDAGVLFEETQRTLLCSDLFHHEGDVEPLTSSDILGRVRQALKSFQTGPMPQYVPYTPNTGRLLHGLSELRPSTLAVMHGSSFSGNGQQALMDLAAVMKEVLGEQGEQSREVAA